MSFLKWLLVACFGVLAQTKESHKEDSIPSKLASTNVAKAQESFENPQHLLSGSSTSLKSAKHNNLIKSLVALVNPRVCNPRQDDIDCSKLSAECVHCDYNISCHYGRNETVICRAKHGVRCKNNVAFEKEITCQFCYQAPSWLHICDMNGVKQCNAQNGLSKYNMRFRTNCTVVPSLFCIGNRNFQKMMPCKWKNGYRWSTALLLSVTLGGFGADRFYLGRWQEGIGKLFSFGGLGLWTIIDIILIGVRYLGPSDGSLYVD